MSSNPRLHGDSPRHRRNVMVVDDVIHHSVVTQEFISKQHSDVAGRHSDPLSQSTVASFASTESLLGSKENLSQFLSVEDRLLDELKCEIFACNARNSDLTGKSKKIQPLERHIDDLERNQNKLTNEISFKHDLIESLKQRVSVLHEQNNQLAKIVESSKSGGADVLSTRNALVASLAQLKTLQDQVNTIPQLKSEIKILTAKNSRYRNISSELRLPDDESEYPSYESLCKENSSLKSKNEALVKGTEVLKADLSIVSDSAEALQKRLDKFEKSILSVSVFKERIKRLEEEKEELYQRSIELKSHRSDYESQHDVSTASQTIAELEKVNSSLQSKLEHLQIDSRTQKGKLALKLLQMEALSVKTHASEIEKQILDLNGDSRSAINSSASASSPDHADLDPSFEVQLLKLQQIQSLRHQSNSVLKLLHSDKQEADRMISELQSQLSQENAVTKRVGGNGGRLRLEQLKMTKSEEQLDANDVSHAGALLCDSEAERNSSQWSMASDSQVVDKDYNSLLHDCQDLKKENRKVRKKLKMSQEKLRSVAKELSSSVDLVKMFQSQCMILQDELNRATLENGSAIQSPSSNVVSHFEAEPIQVSVDIHSSTVEMELKEKLEFEAIEKQKLSENVAELQDKLKLSASAVSAGEDEIERLEKSMAAMQGQLKQTEEVLHMQDGANERLKSEISAYTSEKVPLLTAEVERLTVCCDDAQSRIHSMSKQIKELEIVMHQKGSQVHEADSALVLCRQRLTTNENVQKEMACEIEKLEEQRDQLITECKPLQELSQLQKTELLAKTQANEQLQQEVKMLTSKLDSQMELTNSLEHQCHDHQLQSESKAASTETQLSALSKQLQQSSTHCDQLSHELQSVKQQARAQVDELLGLQATVESLRRQLDIAETREVEHEELRLRIRRLERTINTSSQLKHDNEALLGMLHEAITEMPTLSNETGTELQQENHRLEEQVSVLSQWNDKQRREIEELESRLDVVDGEKHQLCIDLMSKENSAQENTQLKRELKEVEVEVNTLRQQVRADLNEEVKIKLATQAKLLSVFSEHNASLQKQVEELHAQVRRLGGTLERDKAVSPPPMLDGAFIVATEEKHVSDLERENDVLKHHVSYLESEIKRLQETSLTVKRRSGSFCATSSVPLATVDEDFQEFVPPEMLLPCSLMADHLNTKAVDDVSTKTWVESVKKEWFRCVSQKAVSQSCVACYITTISALSLKLLKIVVNLQDEKGNSALHHAIRNGNFPVAKLLIQLSCCDTNIANHAGYTPLMMLCATSDSSVDVRVLLSLVKKGKINYQSKQHLCTPLMLAAATGQCSIVDALLEAGATVNIQDRDGCTALMFAVQNGHVDTVKRLLMAPECDVHLQDSDGVTVEDISITAGYAEISVMIKEHMHAL